MKRNSQLHYRLLALSIILFFASPSQLLFGQASDPDAGAGPNTGVEQRQVSDTVTTQDHGLDLDIDLRLRLEADTDSRRRDGSRRDDRTRLRLRARAQLTYALSDRLSFGVRLRTGATDSHQSPHLTLEDFDDGPNNDIELNFDRWYARIDSRTAWGFIGRDRLPFWTQNELFWDQDVTLVGAAAGVKFGLRDNSSLDLRGGYFTPPVGMRDFSGRLGVFQLRFTNEHLTVAGGILALDADPQDRDASRLLSRNGLRDYTLWIVSLQSHQELFGRALILGVDAVHNSESSESENSPPLTPELDEARDGFVLSAIFGTMQNRGDWLVAYYFAEIEALAVNASYAQDDWLRWGSATETRASGFRGHEVRFAYRLLDNLDLVARGYAVDSLTSPEDGTRARLDLNYRF